MKIELGKTYTDKITGFKGYAIGHVEYLTGCNQTLLAPRSDDSSKKPDSHWFDDQRLFVDIADTENVVYLENNETPGCDISPSTK